MSGLKEHQFCESDEFFREYPGPLSNETHLYYLKSEADKVIAELKEIDSKNRSAYYKDLSMMAKDVERHKYKRCLAMARWCEATALWCYQAANTLPTGFHATLYGKRVMIEPDRLFKRHVLLTKWSARWRELAEKFKPYKEADDGND
jgi:hypothetical protein